MLPWPLQDSQVTQGPARYISGGVWLHNPKRHGAGASAALPAAGGCRRAVRTRWVAVLAAPCMFSHPFTGLARLFLGHSFICGAPLHAHPLAAAGALATPYLPPFMLQPLRRLCGRDPSGSRWLGASSAPRVVGSGPKSAGATLQLPAPVARPALHCATSHRPASCSGGGGGQAASR
jgi:hypothetical protein